MITARLLTILAASSLAAVAYAQTQSSTAAEPSASPGENTSQPQVRSVPGNERASPKARPAPGSGLNTAQHSHRMNESMRMAEAGPSGHPWSSMSVESPSGRSLGSISKVVPGLNGKKSSGYVIVSGSNGMSVPVPYRIAYSMVRDGKLVLSPSQFEHAPRVTQEDLQNSSDHAWRTQADRYWMRWGHAHARQAQ